VGTPQKVEPDQGVTAPPAVQPVPSPPIYTAPGLFDCNQLQALWISQGGNKNDSFIAAEIAMAESGGNPDALSPTDDRGLWQINASHGAESSYDPVVNVRAAIAISDDGTNWGAWTTYTQGLYRGRC
jgi:soluble lytic murein transglycosylase-like protein